MTEVVNISIYSNEFYLQHTCVLLKSISISRNIERIYSIFFFYSDCTINMLEKIRLEFAELKNFEISFIECDKYKQYSSQLKLNHYSMAIYAKVFVYDLLPDTIEKTLFFDSDIILLEDPANLFETDLNGLCIGAVADSYYERVPGKMKKAINLENDSDYFNSGVLLVDVQQWKHTKISEKAIRFLIEKGHQTLFHDQDGFNAVFRGRWKRLSPYWNPGTRNLIAIDNERTEIITAHEIYNSGKAKLIHFHGANKPWLYMSDHPMKSEYLRILAMTGFKDYVFPDKTIVNIIRKRYRSILKSILNIMFVKRLIKIFKKLGSNN